MQQTEFALWSYARSATVVQSLELTGIVARPVPLQPSHRLDRTTVDFVLVLVELGGNMLAQITAERRAWGMRRALDG